MEWQVGNGPLRMASRDNIPLLHHLVGSIQLVTIYASLID